jgi:hypothetical protein
MGKEEDRDIKSTFNAGISFAERTAKLQEVLNDCRVDPLLIPPGFTQPCYMITLKTITSLWLEISPKANKIEKEVVESIKKLTEDYIKSYPICSVNHEGKTTLIQKNIDKINELLEEFERRVRIVLENHDLNSPNKEDPGSAVLG